VCFSIQINQSDFTEIPFGYNLLSDANIGSNLVSELNGLRFQGSVLTLEEFSGEVIVQNSNFSENMAPYDGCIDTDYLMQEPVSYL
jgi:hypothetical protein